MSNVSTVYQQYIFARSLFEKDFQACFSFEQWVMVSYLGENTDKGGKNVVQKPLVKKFSKKFKMVRLKRFIETGSAWVNHFNFFVKTIWLDLEAWGKGRVKERADIFVNFYKIWSIWAKKWKFSIKWSLLLGRLSNIDKKIM